MRLKSISLLGVLCFLLLTACTAEPPKEICSGEIWPDNQGVHVNAHGGGVLYHMVLITGMVRINPTLPAVPWWELCATLQRT